MHTAFCNAEECWCTKPCTVTTNLSIRQQLNLLRAKIVDYFFPDSARIETIIDIQDSCKKDCKDWKTTNWPLSVSSKQHTNELEKHVVLNSATWKLILRPKKEAVKHANNPPIHCGGGFILWLDDVFIRTLGEIVKEKMEHDARRLGDDFPEEAIKKYVVNDFKIYSSIRRLQEQVEDQTGQTLDKRGHFLYYFLCRVVWQINEERHLVNVREEEECKTTDVAKARNVKRRLREEEGCKTIGVAKKVRKVRRRFREKADLNTIGVPEGYESEEAIKDPEN